MVVYTDGSFTPEREGHPAKAGWGVRCVDGNVDGSTDDQGTVCAELCGPVTIDPRDPAFDGAEHLSNNTAEMTALIEALKLLTAKDAPFDTSMPTLVRPDSEYAAKIAVGISRPKKNKQLAEEAAALWKLAKEMRGGKLWLAMVRAHGERRGGVRHEHNHAVDRLAADGAGGRVLSRADLAAGARD